MAEVWRAADDIDVFESGWTSDHFYPLHGADPSGPRLEGWVTLAALAHATRRLRLGTLVTGIHYRHPAVLANMAATLDIISGGRLELGVGTGWNEQESAAYGIELGTPAQRSDRLEEACLVAARNARCVPRHASRSTGTLTPGPPHSSRGRARSSTGTARIWAGTRPASCSPRRCGSPATRPGPPRMRRRSVRQVPGWRSCTCPRRTFPPCWSRWPVRCQRCEAAERRAGAEIRGRGH
jgi:hypothetical protein